MTPYYRHLLSALRANRWLRLRNADWPGGQAIVDAGFAVRQGGCFRLIPRKVYRKLLLNEWALLPEADWSDADHLVDMGLAAVSWHEGIYRRLPERLVRPLGIVPYARAPAPKVRVAKAHLCYVLSMLAIDEFRLLPTHQISTARILVSRGEVEQSSANKACFRRIS